MKCWIIAFHQCLHCFLRQKQSSEKLIQFYLEIINDHITISKFNVLLIIKGSFLIDFVPKMRPNKKNKCVSGNVSENFK